MKTLQDILKKKQEQDDRNNRPKLNWFSLKPGESVRVKFLQELSDEAPNYSKERGTALFLVEHVSPYNFRRKAECTYETEGRCFACEKNQEEKLLIVDGEEKHWPWAQKTNMYIQLVNERGEVQVMSRPAPGSVFNSLHDWAVDENEGSLTGQAFKASKGTNKSDSWNFIPTNKDFDVPETVEVVDLESAIGLKISYEEQRNFYMPAEEKTQEEAPKPKNKHTEEDW